MDIPEDPLRGAMGHDAPDALGGALEAKRRLIRRACDERDVDRLIELADSPGGLVDDELRRTAWPTLLGITPNNAVPGHDQSAWQTMPPHRDEEQIQKDVDRAFVYYPSDEPEKRLDARRKKLYDLIVRVFRSYPDLCYFQGYHDIAQVMLLVLGEELALPSLLRLSLFRIRDYMLHSIWPAVKHLHLIPAVLRRADPALAEHLSHNRPIFALANALTLYAHDVQEYTDIARLYDFLLAHEPVMSIYVFASIVIRRRKELLEIPVEDQDMLQFTLQKLPQPLDLDALIAESLQLFQKHKPETLPGGAWSRISSTSVLKTSRDIKKFYEPMVAQRLFDSQEKQLRREEWVQQTWRHVLKNRRPILSVTAAILVGAVSIWLRRTDTDRILLSFLRRSLSQR